MIHLIQCLCKNRHAIFAVSYPSEEMPDDIALATFQSTIEDWIRTHQIDAWCGICKSTDWHYETRVTPWKTMAEAEPQLKKAEFDNWMSRVIIEQRRREKN